MIISQGEVSGVVQLCGAVRCQMQTESRSGPQELEQLTEHFGQGAKVVIPAPGKKNNNNNSQNTMTLRLQLSLPLLG